jgi:UDP-3-O-[3-hydroxymyristoyl] glucosamine N-acyltransferase
MPPVYSLAELQSRLGGEVRGDGTVRLDGIASLGRAGPGRLSFVVGTKHVDAARASAASALIAPADLADRLDQPLLLVTNPHSAFARATALFHPMAAVVPGIHPTAVVHADARIDPLACIEAHACIGDGARIGPRSRIGPHSVVGEDCEVGADCRLHPHVTLYPGTRLGDRVELHSGCVLGADGFGLAWENDGWLKVPQVGRVIVGDDVEIGANTTVDRGALDDTVIEAGVKIDNLVQIAHNCRIGAHTAIAGCAGIAGSTRIGRHCLIGGAAMILGHIEIGDRVTVSGASFIGKSISEPGVYTSAQPHLPHPEWRRNAAQLRHLAEMRERIRALEKALAGRGDGDATTTSKETS